MPDYGAGYPIRWKTRKKTPIDPVGLTRFEKRRMFAAHDYYDHIAHTASPLPTSPIGTSIRVRYTYVCHVTSSYLTTD